MKGTHKLPHVICHMLCSVDGKIDDGSQHAVMPEGEGESLGETLNGDAWICGNGISHIVSGADSVDLAKALELLSEHFGLRTLLLEGGGHINGAFLEVNLIDEVSLLLVAGIDGRHDIPAVFDGASTTTAVALKLKQVKERENDALWLRYDVVRP